MNRKSRDVDYEGELNRAKGPVVSRVRPDAPRLMGFAESLKTLGVTELAGEAVDMAALEVGEQIREARQGRGLSQSQLAAMVGCKQGDLSNIERGKGKDGPSYRTLRNLAVALGVELPINRRVNYDGSVIVHASGATCVSESATSFDVLAPLFTREHWHGVCNTISGVIMASDAPAHSDTCYLISVEAGAKVLLRAGSAGTIVSAVRRAGGSVHTHRARHRFRNPEPGEPLAILEEYGEVEIQTADEDGMTLMMYPAQAVMARYCEDDADWVG